MNEPNSIDSRGLDIRTMIKQILDAKEISGTAADDIIKAASGKNIDGIALAELLDLQNQINFEVYGILSDLYSGAVTRSHVEILALGELLIKVNRLSTVFTVRALNEVDRLAEVVRSGGRG